MSSIGVPSLQLTTICFLRLPTMTQGAAGRLLLRLLKTISLSKSN